MYNQDIYNYHELLNDLGLATINPCSDEEDGKYTKLCTENKELPKNIYPYDNDEVSGFYKLEELELPKEDELKLLLMKQLRALNYHTSYLRIIKNIAIAFAVLTGINLLLVLIILTQITTFVR